MKPSNSSKRRTVRVGPTRETSEDFFRWLGEKKAQIKQPAETKVASAAPSEDGD